MFDQFLKVNQPKYPEIINIKLYVKIYFGVVYLILPFPLDSLNPCEDAGNLSQEYVLRIPSVS